MGVFDDMASYITTNIVVDPGSACWHWSGNLDKSGYGAYRVRGKWRKAHRESYATFIGAIPAGLHILHKCDVPGCVNPAHLYAGTNAQNVADKVARGRVYRPVGVNIKTRCHRGHELVPSNRVAAPKGRNFGQCKTCMNYHNRGASWLRGMKTQGQAHG